MTAEDGLSRCAISRAPLRTPAVFTNCFANWRALTEQVPSAMVVRGLGKSSCQSFISAWHYVHISAICTPKIYGQTIRLRIDFVKGLGQSPEGTAYDLPLERTKVAVEKGLSGIASFSGIGAVRT